MKNFDELRDLPRRMAAAVDLAVRQTAFDTAQKIAVDAPVFTGFLRNSFDHFRTPRGWGVRTAAAYAGWLDTGKPPHMPPVGALTTWVRRRMGKRGAEAENTAWAIALKLAREGTRPRRFIKKNASRRVVHALLRMHLQQNLKTI